MEELREGNTIIVAGNGPSIANVPEKLFEKYPLFCMNRWPSEHDVPGRYWTAWDTWSLVENLPLAKEQGSHVFLNRRIWDYFQNTFSPRTEGITWYTTSGPPEIPTSEKTGAVFITTTHAAVWLSYKMGYKKILLVGFDCTIGTEPRHNNPHFYDPDKPAVYAQDWDEQMAMITGHLDDNEVELANLSEPTASQLIWKGDVKDYV